MNVVAAIQCRLPRGKRRLPDKELLKLRGLTVVDRIITRLRSCMLVDDVVLACPERDVARFTEGIIHDALVYGGPEDDVLGRMVHVAQKTDAEYLVRVTGDCPLVCPDLVDNGVRRLIEADWKVSAAQSWRPRTWPDGFDFEVWRVADLGRYHAFLKGRDREYFAQWALDLGIPTIAVTSKEDYSRLRLTLDYPEDLKVIRALYDDMEDDVWMSRDILDWCTDHPNIMRLNRGRVDTFGELP